MKSFKEERINDEAINSSMRLICRSSEVLYMNTYVRYICCVVQGSLTLWFRFLLAVKTDNSRWMKKVMRRRLALRVSAERETVLG